MHGSSGVPLAVAALARGPSLSAASRCVSNPNPAQHAPLFAAVRERLVDAYARRTPTCVSAVEMLSQRGATVYNDHVAMRSFVDSSGRSGLAFLEHIFLAFGYAPEDSITIPGMPLNARWYEPPEETGWPKVFISEMRAEELPPEVASIVYRHVDGYYEPERVQRALSSGDVESIAALIERPPWSITSAEEEQIRRVAHERPELASTTEYAAWTLTHAHRWNHLTILVNTLGGDAGGFGEGDVVAGGGQPVRSLADMNALLRLQGFQLNAAGGVDGFTQGSAEVHLEQSSTVADNVQHTFACGTTRAVPCSFLELIARHDGFRAFLGQNARGIFDSTNVRAEGE